MDHLLIKPRAATLKHFAVHGQPEGGTNVGRVTIPNVIREYFRSL
jgi:beta-glucosidase-like glycosyl hydrolase